MKMFRKNNKGFTLVELLVVIAIIAILAAVIAPNAFKAIEKSKVSAVISDYRAVKIATLVYYSDVGLWPESSTEEGHDPGFVKNPWKDTSDDDEKVLEAAWNGPYLDVWTENAPLGGEYMFVNDDHAVYLLIRNLPEDSSAYKKLKADLGDDLVGRDSTVHASIKIADK